MPARFIVADVFDGLATLEDGSVDLVVTSPPFLALRSYLPADHPNKAKEIGSEATPAEFLDVLLRVTAELRRVLAPHGSICIELGDTYASAGGVSDNRESSNGGYDFAPRDHRGGGQGWPLAKSKTLIPELYRVALAYGINPLTGQPSPAERWRVRNTVTWCRPNPPVGALGDKWRPATSDVVIACTSDKRYWDDIATRRPHQIEPTGEPDFTQAKRASETRPSGGDQRGYMMHHGSPAGAPLLDYWEIAPGGYQGAHYAVFPPALVEPLIEAMAPPKVCRTCGEPSRRIVSDPTYAPSATYRGGSMVADSERLGENVNQWVGPNGAQASVVKQQDTLGWSDCGHDNYRPSLILDPFAGSGTTLAVATGHGHDAIGIDLDERNAELAEQRIGPLMFERVSLDHADRSIQGLGRVHTGEQ